MDISNRVFECEGTYEYDYDIRTYSTETFKEVPGNTPFLKSIFVDTGAIICTDEEYDFLVHRDRLKILRGELANIIYSNNLDFDTLLNMKNVIESRFS